MLAMGPRTAMLHIVPQLGLCSNSSSTYLSFSSARTPPTVEEGQPDSGIFPHLGDNLVSNGSGLRAARSDRQFVIQPCQLALQTHSVMSLLAPQFLAFWPT